MVCTHHLDGTILCHHSNACPCERNTRRLTHGQSIQVYLNLDKICRTIEINCKSIDMKYQFMILKNKAIRCFCLVDDTCANSQAISIDKICLWMPRLYCVVHENKYDTHFSNSSIPMPLHQPSLPDLTS